jgi:hypothetical protein
VYTTRDESEVPHDPSAELTEKSSANTCFQPDRFPIGRHFPLTLAGQELPAVEYVSYSVEGNSPVRTVARCPFPCVVFAVVLQVAAPSAELAASMTIQMTTQHAGINSGVLLFMR